MRRPFLNVFFFSKPALAVLALGLFALSAQAQDPTTADDEKGISPYGSYNGGDIDSVGLTTGVLNLNFPLLDYPQRGKLHLSFNMIYVDDYQHYAYYCAPHGTCNLYWGYVPEGSSTLPLERSDVQVGTAQNLAILAPFYKPEPTITTWSNFILQMADGSKHPLGNKGTMTKEGTSPDAYYQYSGPFETLDATSWRVNGAMPNASGDDVPTSIIDPNGVSYKTATAFEEDPNGNQITLSSGVFTDSLGRQIPSPPTASTASNTNTSACPQPPEVLLTVDHAVLWAVPGPSGNNVSYTYCYAKVAINIPNTNAGATAFAEMSLQSIVLPNGQAWNFQYNDPGDGSTYNGSPVNYGTLTQIALPTGGTISYTYTIAGTTSQQCANAGRWVASRSLNANDGTGSHTWTYSYTTATVTDPLGNYVVHTFSNLGSTCTPYETETQSYQSGGTILKTVTTNYSYTDLEDVSTGNEIVVNVVPTQITTTWGNGQASSVTKGYDSGFSYTGWMGSTGLTGIYGRQLSEADFDYSGSLLRTTKTNYLPLSNSTYLTYNLFDAVSSQQVLDVNGVQRAYTTYSYDGSTPVTSGITTQHVTPPNGTYRGNLTSTVHWLNTTGTYLTSTNTYFDTGMIDVAKDPNLNPTTYGYSSTYVGAFPTTVTNALGQVTTNAYDFDTGLLTSTIDPNNLTSSYQYDSMRRSLQIDRPDGGQALFCYTDTGTESGGATCTQSSPPYEVVVSEKINSSTNQLSYLMVDGVGRQIRHAVTNGESLSYDETDTCYDGAGRVSFKSYAFQDSGPFTTSRSCGSPELGDSFAYDGLNRTTSVTHSDGSVISSSYSGNSTTVTDEQGKARQSTNDGLGRLTQVIEDPGTNPHLNYTTAYSYDALDNLVGVTQASSRQRTFVYDSLSRITSSTHPEANWAPATQTSVATTYIYDADGNLINKTEPAQNQQSSSTITLTYCYDGLNRMTAKGYTSQTCTNQWLPTPVATFVYDGGALPSGCSVGSFSYGSAIGKRTAMCDAAGSEAWSYNIAAGTGWQITDKRTTNALTKTTVYQDNFLSLTSSIQYPSGRTITYAYNAGARPTSALDGTTSVYYANTAHYWAGGSPCWTVYGAAITGAATYNGRLQPLRLQSTGSVVTYPGSCGGLGQTGTLLDLSYNFNYGSGDNGNVMGITNNRDTTRSQAFGYDVFNRLLTATASTYTASPSHCWGEAYVYDNNATGGAWGNLTGISSAGSAYTGCTQESLGVTATAQNQIANGTSIGYDTAGNMTTNSGSTYSYDAENHLTATAGVSYTYDGDGKRVEKSNGKIYWYGMDGSVLDETDLTGSTTNSSFSEYIFFGEKRIGRRDSSNNVYYYTGDHLSTSRVIAEVPSGQTTPTLCYDADFYPFGGERAYTTACVQNYKFTGKERDAESSLDDFRARFDSSSLGRFMSPDPVTITPERFYDPQQLDEYSYTRNNPLKLVDPTGMILTLFGNIGMDIQDLCSIVGPDDCDRLSVDGQGVVSFDTTGLDLSKNAGADLVNSLVQSSNNYGFSEGPTVQTAAGTMTVDYVVNLDKNPDARYSMGKSDNSKPPSGIDDIVAINRNPNGKLKSLTNLQLAPLYTVAFHELAEAFAKIDGGAQYKDAHTDAMKREDALREQRPYLKQYNPGSGGPVGGPPDNEIIMKK
jgi:RHS repeat-associated protein